MKDAVVIFIHRVMDNQVISTAIDGNYRENVPIIDLTGVLHVYRMYKETGLCLNTDHYDQTESIKIENILSNMERGVKLNFPTLIKCQNCETNFSTKYQYQRHQCEFDTAEKGDEAHECSVCNLTFANQSSMERHQLASHSENNTCEYCGKQFVSENRLRIHKENHCKKAGGISKFYRSDVTVWKCKKCHEVFSCAENATRHSQFCLEAKENIETVSTEVLLQCEFCNRTFSDKNLLLKHQREHTTVKNYECVDCNKIFDSYPLAATHWMKKCSEISNVFFLPKLVYCEYCDRTFKSHELLYNHKVKKKHYTPKLHVAVNVKVEESEVAKDNKDIVNKLIQDVLTTLEFPMEDVVMEDATIKTEFLNDDYLNSQQSKKRLVPRTNTARKKHCSSTEEGFRYQCERCIKVFSSITSLESHRSSEHVATFSCEECGQTLGSAKALLVHSRGHKSLKPYVCDTCGRSYSQTSHLWQHMRFHQGIKPFACSHEGCEARYTIRTDLKDHIRKVHTRERPFKCSVCNKCFLTGSVYYQHRLIHTNDRRYGCEVCQKRFFRADALNNHKRIHTGERPYSCNVCCREFRQKGDRNKHMRTQHPEHFSG